MYSLRSAGLVGRPLTGSKNTHLRAIGTRFARDGPEVLQGQPTLSSAPLEDPANPGELNMTLSSIHHTRPTLPPANAAKPLISNPNISPSTHNDVPIFELWDGPVKFATRSEGLGGGKRSGSGMARGGGEGEGRRRVRGSATYAEGTGLNPARLIGVEGARGSEEDEKGVMRRKEIRLDRAVSQTTHTSALPQLANFIDLTIPPPPRIRPSPPPNTSQYPPAQSRSLKAPPIYPFNSHDQDRAETFPSPIPQLPRPRAVPRYTSPEARTAMTPPRRSKVKEREEGRLARGNNGVEIDITGGSPGVVGIEDDLWTVETSTRSNGVLLAGTRLHPFFRPASRPSFLFTGRQSPVSTPSTQSLSETFASSAMTPPPPPMASQPRMSGFYASISGTSESGSGSSRIGIRAGEFSGSIPSIDSFDISAESLEHSGPAVQKPSLSRASSSSVSFRSATFSLPSRGPSPCPATTRNVSTLAGFGRMPLHTSATDSVGSDPRMKAGIHGKDGERHVPRREAFSWSKGKARDDGPPPPDMDGLDVENARATAPEIDSAPVMYTDVQALERGVQKLELAVSTSSDDPVPLGDKQARLPDGRTSTGLYRGSKASVSEKPQSRIISWAMLNTGGPLTDFSYTTYKTLHPVGSDRAPYRPPHVVYVTSASEANDLIPCLTGNVMGFDLEWPVSMGKAKSTDAATGKVKWREWMRPGKVALAQVGNEKIVLLIHLSLMDRIPEKLIELCMDKSIHKVGVGIKNDGHKLVRDFDIRCRSLLELTHLARRVDPLGTGPGSMMISLRNLTKAYLGYDLPKGDVRRSDWQAALSREQVEYAANDVVSAVLIYKRLIAIAKERNLDFELPSMDLHAELAQQEAILTKSGGASGRSTGLTPAELRSYVLFSVGQTLRQMTQTMGTFDNPLAFSTVQTYLVSAHSKDPSLRFDPARLHGVLSEGSGKRSSAQRALLAKLAAQMKDDEKTPGLDVKLEDGES